MSLENHETFKNRIMGPLNTYLNELAIGSGIKFGAHTWPQAQIAIVWVVERWQDECRSCLTNP